ncbi:MAG: tetratricopeptide repeat protein [Clostridiales bacterium]|nr:tetratricopeptide repeat protein [Clostridiales bacterium]
MKNQPRYDETEFEDLYLRLFHQRENAFFCVVVDDISLQSEIAEEMSARFNGGEVQIIDFRNMDTDFAYSSEYLIKNIRKESKIVFLTNFQLAKGDMPDIKFYQILNFSRDALAKLPCVLVFVMPMYFRVMIARNAPDFNSFFQYRADFVKNASDDEHDMKFEINGWSERYSETSRKLLEYYLEKYNELLNLESKEAFEIIIKILNLNDDVRVLHLAELTRFNESFNTLLKKFEHDANAKNFEIAKVLYSQGNYLQALEWYMKEVHFLESDKNFNPDSIRIFGNIAATYSMLGKFDIALDWCDKAIEMCNKAIGKVNSFLLTFIYQNKAEAYEGLHKNEEALKIRFKVKDIREESLGFEHPDTAKSYSAIGSSYHEQKDYLKALEWYQKAMDICKRVLGDHTSTANCHDNIAGIYFAQGEYRKALEELIKSLNISEKVLGKEHPFTAHTYSNIAVIYNRQGNHKKAIELFEKSYRILLKTLGANHQKTINVKLKLTKVLAAAGLEYNESAYLTE